MKHPHTFYILCIALRFHVLLWLFWSFGFHHHFLFRIYSNFQNGYPSMPYLMLNGLAIKCIFTHGMNMNINMRAWAESWAEPWDWAAPFPNAIINHQPMAASTSTMRPFKSLPPLMYPTSISSQTPMLPWAPLPPLSPHSHHHYHYLTAITLTNMIISKYLIINSS